MNYIIKFGLDFFSLVRTISFMEKTTILITGAGGSVGQMLLAHFVKDPSLQIRALERSEQAIAELLHLYKDNKNIELYFADLMQPETLSEPLSGCDIVIHCAAYKHVNIGKAFPTQQVQENITAFCNILNLSRRAKIKKFLFCSTDKAATPTSVMGSTKYLLEQICMNATTPSFTAAAVRFGNILWSNGSLLPLIEKKIMADQDITLNHEQMTRYLMHKHEVIDLILFALENMRGGEIFTYNAVAASIKDVMEVVLEKSAKKQPKIVISTKATHENIHERFIHPEEAGKVRKQGQFLAIHTSYGNKPDQEELERALSSKTKLLSKSEIKKFLYDQHPT